MFFITRGFNDRFINKGFAIKSPDALEQKSKVILSFATLNPGADLSFREMYVRPGYFLPK